MDETDDHFQIRLVDGTARGRYVSGCFKAADVSYDVQILLSFHRFKKKNKRLRWCRLSPDVCCCIILQNKRAAISENVQNSEKSGNFIQQIVAAKERLIPGKSDAASHPICWDYVTNRCSPLPENLTI